MMFAVAACALFYDPANLGGDDSRAASPGDELPISAAPLPLNVNDPGVDRIGALRFMGAVHIRSSDPAFGGISGLRAGKNGYFLAVTDTGNWLSFRSLERDGRLVGIREARLVPMRDGEGKIPEFKRDIDAEALEWDPESGDASVVFEGQHRLMHWKGLDPARPATLSAPARWTERLPEMVDWPSNGGGEAVVVWKAPDGQPARVIVGEDRVLEDGHRLTLFTHKSRTRYVGIEGVPEHKPTDAVMLDGSRMLLLHRRFNLKGIGAAVSMVDLSPLLAVKPATRLKGQVLASWAMPFTLDNMEGIAVVREGKRTFVFIVSDDNLTSLQKTVLMKFELMLSS
ncbi:esterase-like activity of phytase family protein [Polymorphobacter sp.]|uniref:esterase-like activity of phytase family protein n=1 Tax=Polymorphobacter sp. TaxID=1909290 RepID=UPI003F72EEBA